MLRLELHLRGERYCSGDVDAGMVQLRYILRFANTGSQSVILSKDAGPVLEILAARDRAGLDVPVPEYRALVTNMFSRVLPLDSAKPGPGVIVLRPGKSFLVRKTVSVMVSRNPTSPRFLNSGDYFLQIVVQTWLNSEDLGAQQRERWKGWGYLWTDPIKSEPTRISIVATHKMSNCD
jgi:hypothetical protein